MQFYPAAFQNYPFDKKAKEYGKPEYVHRPTARNRISCRVKGPPEELYPHKHK